jgi:dienelactone hydrolase
MAESTVTKWEKSFMKKLLICCLVIITFPVHARIIDQQVDYAAGTTTLKGYIAYDDDFKGPRPAVIVVHEWWGHNEYARHRARQLARMGYVGMAVDMYGDGKQAAHPDDAMKFSGEISDNIDLGRQRFTAAMAVLNQHKLVEPNKIAAIGYCFGGSVVLQMAREGVDLRAVASFHGGLGTKHPATAGNIKAEIFVAHGGLDPFVGKEQLSAFIDEMNKAGANYKIEVFSGAVHAFTNPAADELGKRFNLPLAYNQRADEDSWQDLQLFLRGIFGKI